MRRYCRNRLYELWLKYTHFSRVASSSYSLTDSADEYVYSFSRTLPWKYPENFISLDVVAGINGEGNKREKKK